MHDNTNIDEFIASYRSTERICVFTGAGVSFTQDKRYRAPGWKQLLNEILFELLGTAERQESETIFSELETKHVDLWDLATAVKTYAQSKEAFLQAFRKVVLKENESADSDGRLKTRNIDGATTLNATISFCSRIKEIRIHPCFAVNPKIEAVLTANYDPFLEAGATKKHESSLFKPMSRPSSTFKQGQLPVYHIHGYLPFGKKKKGEDQSSKIIPLPTEPLILDRDSYEQAYQPGSWTLCVLEHFLRKRTTLFIGFSFNDEYFLRELSRLGQEPHAPVHYALLREEDERPSGLLDEIRCANVRPVLYAEHDQIPNLLAHSYQSVLPTTEIRIPKKDGGKKLVNPDNYWKMLWFDKRWKGKSQSLRDKKKKETHIYT